MDGRRNAWLKALGAIALLLGTASCGISTDGPTNRGLGDPGADFLIEELRASDVTDTTAVITWKTTRTSVGSLTFDTHAALVNTRRVATRLGTEHRAELEDLEPSTIYYYKAQATATTGDTTSARGTAFKTNIDSELIDDTSPVISDIELVGVTSSSAEIHWTTDDRTRGSLLYGLTLPLDMAAVEYPGEPDKYTRGHGIVLTGLQDGTLYHYGIEATNKANLTSITLEDFTFTTLASPTLGFCPDTVEVTSESAPFQIDICISDAQDLGGLTTIIDYSPSQIEIVSVDEHPLFRGEGGGRLNGDQFFVHNRSPGHLQVEATWLIQYQGLDVPVGTLADGDFSFCVLTCRLKSGVSAAEFTVSERFDSGSGKLETRLYDFNRLDVGFHTRAGVIRLVARGTR